MTTDLPTEPIFAQEQEAIAIKHLEQLLTNSVQLKLTDDSEAITLPKSLIKLLQQAVQSLVAGSGVSVAPINKLLMLGEAAQILNVSSEYLREMLAQEVIPFEERNGSKYINCLDLFKYKKQRDVERKKALVELTQMSQELGFYD